MPSRQWSVTGGRFPRDGKWKSIESRFAHAPAQPQATSFTSTLSGTTLPSSSAQNGASMMCVPMLPMDPLP